MAEAKHHADYSRFVHQNKEELLEQVVESYAALAEDTTDWVSNLANAAALLWYAYNSETPDINWAGFYVSSADSEWLTLGPFQGRVACQKIKSGRGVCGTAFEQKATQVVPDVESFPGHIACDGVTKSEIVVPIIVGEQAVGVIDIDSVVKNKFDEVDQKWLEKLSEKIAGSCNWSSLKH